MNDNRWKVKMVRQLTNKVSPDVICESSFEYELPADWGDMLNGFDHIDEEYRQSILSGIHLHLQKSLLNLDFLPKNLYRHKSLRHNDLGRAGQARRT